eukprot:417671-Pelagomonas_calceolata.AAC.2
MLFHRTTPKGLCKRSFEHHRSAGQTPPWKDTINKNHAVLHAELPMDCRTEALGTHLAAKSPALFFSPSTSSRSLLGTFVFFLTGTPNFGNDIRACFQSNWNNNDALEECESGETAVLIV